MKRFALRSAIAFLTFSAGLAIASLLVSNRARVTLHEVKPVDAQSRSTTRPAPNPKPSADESGLLDAVFVKDDRLSYLGYEVERSFDPATRLSSATVKKGGKTLVTLGQGGLGKGSTEFGLFPFLGGDARQLVVLQYTGGAHCCWVYHIYQLTPRFRPLFDGGKYGIDSIGYELNPVDLDGDGRYEFTQSVMTFDYFHMSHASSVFPTAVFSFDERKGKYLPANRKFADHLLKNIDEEVKKVEEERGKIGAENIIGKERYLAAVLRVLLTYIYAGKEADGWAFYGREYQLGDKGEIRTDIRKALAGDPIYRSIYR